MGRSLYGMLHRRFGRRPTGAERVRHARQFEERLRAVLPIGVLQARPAAGAPSPTAAVIGRLRGRPCPEHEPRLERHGLRSHRNAGRPRGLVHDHRARPHSRGGSRADRAQSPAMERSRFESRHK